nr:hypothetical protein GCM10020063_092290 [Dactylosporangium thailandense]
MDLVQVLRGHARRQRLERLAARPEVPPRRPATGLSDVAVPAEGQVENAGQQYEAGSHKRRRKAGHDSNAHGAHYCMRDAQDSSQLRELLPGPVNARSTRERLTARCSVGRRVQRQTEP